MIRLFRIPDEDNLVTYYMLPLVGVNKKTFSTSFKASYISKDGQKVYVELKHNMKSPFYKMTDHYETELLIGDTLFVQFSVPLNFMADSIRFISGEYSKMSKEAKYIIFTTSTLPFNSKKGSFTVSHPVLQALDRTKTLRAFLKDEIGISPGPNDELIDSPHEDWFMEHRIKT